ncbi:isoprenylcysteine carboxylmethyltransferase family protein [Aureimonas fodinaquatilis]|uniref:Isoprenylcysteine carboxylmethyltransferase family protein n=1 Tax=Aureimonas fodinaquatilis TaxID=2565783 RepID=A0A5B0E1W7_9HYPH|nr:isoprenylcysteine carboxylmethyltransferase family protein [Aureimonas fodinaquatilis]KAA0971730.1 isoprenylcysteine carboxylmethyltransferase family protein [Aureimonas fodinaquatilis]
MSLSGFQKMRRLVLALIISLAFLTLLFVASAGSSEMHEGVEVAGLILIGAGIIGRLWCTAYIGGRKAAEIVETGPYAMTRNPLYFFSSIAAAGVGAQTGSILLALVFGIGCMLAFHFVILREETFLRGQFNAAYEEYCRRVPRFFPSIGLFQTPETVAIRPDRLYLTLKDGLMFLAAIPAFEAIEYFQTTGILTPVLHLY